MAQNVIQDILERLTAGETLHNYEARLRCKDGTLRDVLIDSNVLWHDQTFVHTRCFTRDITDHKRVEQAVLAAHQEKDALLLSLRESEEKFRLMSDSIPQLAWMARPDGHIFWCNKRWYEYTLKTSASPLLPPFPLVSGSRHFIQHDRFMNGRRVDF